MTAQFKKYSSGVYCLETDQEGLTHGSEVSVTTRHGKEVDVVVWKFLKSVNGRHYYSYVRADGHCAKEAKLRRAERFEKASERSQARSDYYYERGFKDAAFLALAEPIKVGHHSEKRHRKIIQEARDNADRAIAENKKAEDQKVRARGARNTADNIFMDHPDCLGQLQEKLETLTNERDGYKALNQAKRGTVPGYKLTNIGARIRDTQRRLKTAEALWSLDDEAETQEAAE